MKAVVLMAVLEALDGWTWLTWRVFHGECEPFSELVVLA